MSTHHEGSRTRMKLTDYPAQQRGAELGVTCLPEGPRFGGYGLGFRPRGCCPCKRREQVLLCRQTGKSQSCASRDHAGWAHDNVGVLMSRRRCNAPDSWRLPGPCLGGGTSR